ncbi:hypothetical protein RJ641_024244 [Dillenia turbinata]|uniref:Pentatricopeptide repeat-containing protein n=1 Tax=Dillenia turbinata TaxID=194707 RepID=A0AAN8YT93_9MAGN
MVSQVRANPSTKHAYKVNRRGPWRFVLEGRPIPLVVVSFGGQAVTPLVGLLKQVAHSAYPAPTQHFPASLHQAIPEGSKAQIQRAKFPRLVVVCPIWVEVESHVIRFGFESDIDVVNSLITMYVKCGNIWSGRMLFDKMPVREDFVECDDIKNVMCVEGLELLFRMGEVLVEPNLMTMTSVISACELLGD